MKDAVSINPAGSSIAGAQAGPTVIVKVFVTVVDPAMIVNTGVRTVLEVLVE